MRAVLCKEWGGPDSLVVDTVAPPTPGPGQVRVAVKTVGVNFADTLIIAGKYQVKPPFPFSPGLEIAGVVDALGADVDDLSLGDRVIAVPGHGGYAEQVVADRAQVFVIPDGMTFDDAAAFPVAYGTAHVALVHRAKLRHGETLLVHGASGGVGLATVEVGARLGARVIGAARGAEKLAIARAAGAQDGIDTGGEDIRERVRALTEGRGVDVVFDPVGGDAFDASLRCLALEARIIVIGFASGRIPQIPANILLVKNCDVLGVYWGAYFTRAPEIIRESFAALFAWYAEGALRPHISHRFPLARAADAMAMLLSRKSTGKVVLTVD